MPRALISVYDKSNLVPFAASLIELGWDIVASGGTEKALQAAGIPVTAVERLTGMPELLDGRVKTLHPAIHAGILARDRADDLESLKRHNLAPINLVVSNLYPFQQTISQAGVSLQDAIEQIDIGGVALLRAAAKNFLHVAVVCEPADYNKIIAELKATGQVGVATRKALAIKVFALTRDYDTAIHSYLADDLLPTFTPTALPEQLSFGAKRVETLRYGENPHQIAAYYSRQFGNGPLGGEVLGGKQLSYNNILDLDAAWRAVNSFSEPCVVIVKHLNPTGIACSTTVANAYAKALQSDPVSAFGGVVAVNRQVDVDFVTALGSLFVEAVVAPGFSSEAQADLLSNRKNCRLLRMLPGLTTISDLEIRTVLNGFLVQSRDNGDPTQVAFKVMTERHPTDIEMLSLKFAWAAVQHIKSNAIVLANGQSTVGIGGGLSSRVDAAKLAVEKAGARAKGAVMASDAFFPFADGVEAAIAAGITAIIQPGGSIRDKEVIEAANKSGIAMLFTGVRHFRH
jgi:phosphoribosylaminoimidazolecarboxamide formyltransferase/IMP cyclohydrolase